jgi:NAD(P)H dehydrogenase (quinone)
VEAAVSGAADVAVLGAAGQTGRRVVRALARRGANVRAVVREARPAAEQPEAADVEAADLGDAAALTGALAGAGAVYHVPPAFSAQEVAFGANVIAAARAAGVRRVVYHSVLHAFTPSMPHHRRKAEVELALRESPLTWTVVQPAMYAQTPLQFLDPARTQLTAPFDPDQPFTPVDLEDLAEAVATVLLDTGHDFATYELAGPETVGLAGMAAAMARVLGREVPLRRVPAAGAAGRTGAPADMRAMLEHYDAHGLVGNANILRMLLGREPTGFEDVMRRELAGQTS